MDVRRHRTSICRLLIVKTMRKAINANLTWFSLEEVQIPDKTTNSGFVLKAVSSKLT